MRFVKHNSLMYYVTIVLQRLFIQLIYDISILCQTFWQLLDKYACRHVESNKEQTHFTQSKNYKQTECANK
jgi:hypothetical protein